MIFEQTYNLLNNKYRNQFGELVISDVRIGIYLTAVQLSDGSTGTSATLPDDHPFCAKHNRDFGEFTPLNIKGHRVADILEVQKDTGLISSLKTAVINAISLKILTYGNYKILENCDPVQLLDLNSNKTISIIGAFQSYIRKISETKNRLFVLEMNESALAQDQRKFFIPAGDYRKVLPVSDIVIITGQTLVNRTIDSLLPVIREGTQVILTGPSTGILPDVLFANKVTMIGTVRITKPDILFDIVSEGGTGYHLFEYCARKICILKGDEQQA